jgi:putative oxygen-independent coproporphyrinogen III oxidase
MRSISLYVHVPFCRRRCPYCTFYHIPLGDGTRERSLVDALVNEFKFVTREIGEPFSVPTVYIGGGTPAVIGFDELRRILEPVVPRLDPAGAEITVEMNPEDVDESVLAEAALTGVNRVSLGVQSMSPRAQEVLGRCPPEFNRAALELVSDQFDNFNADILAGIPGAPAGEIEATIAAVGEYDPPHYSVYCLEPGGDIDDGASGFFASVDPDRSAAEYLEACSALDAHGYTHYEVSNFARPGRECAHNLAYWEGAEYIGIGPGAHSFVGSERYRNLASVDRYIARSSEYPLGIRRRDRRGVEETALERIMLGLRTSSGVPLSIVAAPPGAIEEIRAEGLAVVGGGRLRLTDRGFLVLNEIIHRLNRPV